MKDNKKGIISFDGYKVFNLIFLRKPSFNPGSTDGGEYRFQFMYGSTDAPDGEAQVNLIVKAFYGSKDQTFETSDFSVSVEIGGKFKNAEEGPWDHVWDANAIAILYPYVRALISSVTAQSGEDTIVLPTINAAALLLNNKSATRTAAEE